MADNYSVHNYAYKVTHMIYFIQVIIRNNIPL